MIKIEGVTNEVSISLLGRGNHPMINLNNFISPFSIMPRVGSNDPQDKSCCIYLLSVGEELEPLKYDMMNSALKPHKIFLVCTPQTEDRAKELRNWILDTPIYENSFKEKDVELVSTSPTELSTILGDIKERLSKHILSNGKDIFIVSNITGGTKVMSLALHIISSMFNKSAIYYVYYDKWDKTNKTMYRLELPSHNPYYILIKNRLIKKRGGGYAKTSFYTYLDKIDSSNGELFFKDLCDLLKKSKDNVSKTLKEMKKEGLVTLVDEGRYKKVCMTEKGRYMLYITQLLFDLRKGGIINEIRG